MTTTPQDQATLRLAAGRAKAAELQPYLRTALFAIKPIREPRINTLGVDQQWRMYWNPDFILTTSVDECAGAWLHEVGHLLREHRARFDGLLEPQNRHPLWNKAGDAAINADLREARVVLPPIKAIYPEQIPGAERGMLTEQMYRLILDTPDADLVTGQTEELVLMPSAVATHKAEGQTIIGITRSGFLDTNDFTITLTAIDGPHAGEAALLRDEKIHDRRTLSFVIAAEIAGGTYQVAVTSNERTVETTLDIVDPRISLRPDHVAKGWTAPYKVTVVGSLTDFTSNALVALTDGDGNSVAVTDVERVSAGYLNFNIAEECPDGVYEVTVTDNGKSLTAALPIGMPFLDLFPDALPLGHGTPYPIAAVADDFTFDNTTTLDLNVVTPLGLAPLDGALGSLVVKNATTLNFTLDESLPEGQYVVIATTGPDSAAATLTVSKGASGEGEGDGDNDGKDSNGEDSNGEDSNGEGGQPPLDDCGSGVGGAPRPWDRGTDTSDGAVDPGRGNLIREQVARDIAEHQKSRGDVPGGWTRWSDSILKPQVDWRKELRSVVRRTCATVAGMRDYTYQRPSRRASAMPNIVLPAMRAPRPPQAAVVIDTSGSVSDRMLGQAISDMKALLKQITATGGSDIKLIACDAAAADMKSVRDMKNLTSLEGGGGTDMRVGIEAAAAIAPRVDIVVTFTDGETPWPDAPPATNPKAKYIAVLLAGETSDYYAVPDWMHTIVVDQAYLRENR